MNTSTSSSTTPLWQATYDQYGLDNNLDVLDGKQNLLDLLQPKIEQHSELPAFSMGAATLTFGQLDIASRRFAAFLQAQGIEKGDRIAVQLPNILQYAVVLLGCLRAGVVLVNVNPMYTQYELAHQLTDAQACGLIVLDGMSTAYEQLDNTVKAQLKWVVRCSIDPSVADNDIALLSQIASVQSANTDEQTRASAESTTESSKHNITFAHIMQAMTQKRSKSLRLNVKIWLYCNIQAVRLASLKAPCLLITMSWPMSASAMRCLVQRLKPIVASRLKYSILCRFIIFFHLRSAACLVFMVAGKISWSPIHAISMV